MLHILCPRAIGLSQVLISTRLSSSLQFLLSKTYRRDSSVAIYRISADRSYQQRFYHNYVGSFKNRH